MPFNDTDSDQLQRTTQNTVMDYLRTELNNPSGSYYAVLGLSPSKLVFVTPSAEAASVAYKQDPPQPAVMVFVGKCDEESARRAPGGVLRRYKLTLGLDMTMSDHASEETEPVAASDNDRKLVDAVRAIISRGYTYFSGLGMEGIKIETDDEKQKAGVGRNPMVISFACSTLTTA